MTAEELDNVYAAWSGQLHHYVVKHLSRHVDVEYFHERYCFRIYSGYGQDPVFGFGVGGGGTVPNLSRPEGERSETIQVPTPADNPTQIDLDNAFRALCLAAARVLEVELDKPKLSEEISMLKHASSKSRHRRARK